MSPVYDKMRQGLVWGVPVVCEDRIHKQRTEEHMGPTENSALTPVSPTPHPRNHSHIGSVKSMILVAKPGCECTGCEGRGSRVLQGSPWSTL